MSGRAGGLKVWASVSPAVRAALNCGVVQVGQVARFGIFLKSASRWVPDGWVGLIISSYRCYFRTFQLGLDILGTKNVGNGPVVEKLQPFEVGRIPEISGKSELSSASTRTRNDNW